MADLLIVKTGETLPELARRRGDYEDWIVSGLGVDWARVKVARVFRGDGLPDARSLAGVVVTGSSALVTDREEWSERAARWLAGAVGRTPVLGICYGHQLLAHGLGGRVGRNPHGREIGTIRVRLSESAAGDPLLTGLAGPLRVQSTHVESVLELPPGARGLGSSGLDPHAAFAVGRDAWGVQFHPEFDAEVIREYLAARREAILAEGHDADALLAGVSETPDGTALLRRFADRLRG